MTRAARVVLELEDWVEADIEAAAAEGESTADTAARIVTEWAALRRAESPAFVAKAKAAVAESRRDPRPPIPADEVFDRLEARYAAMVAEADKA